MERLDAQGNVLQTWVGTNASGATDANPGNDGNGGNNMVEVSSSVYDADSNLLTATQYVSGQANRTTQYAYATAHWLLSTMTFDGANYAYSYNTYDNLDEVTKTQDYQAAAAWTVNTATDAVERNRHRLRQPGPGLPDDAIRGNHRQLDQRLHARFAGNHELPARWATGILTAEEDPDGNVTSWQYNAFGEAVQQSNVQGTSYSTFDAAGELTQSTDADGPGDRLLL